MHPPSLKTAVRRIRSLAEPPDGPADAELLARFRAARDDRAFAALVARHGPAVLGTCRRILADPHAAEDAFQATFLVLARRPGSVRKAAALGCWLHGVAVRVSLKLKGRLARAPRSVATVEVPAIPKDEVLWRDVRRVLDEEVNRLPDRLRLPVFLCYYEGKTRDEAAEALGWKITTFRGRLEDGRQRLRTRLTRRGIELSAALLAVSAGVDGLAIGDALVESTVRAAGGAATGVVRELARGVVASAMLGKTTLTTGAIVLTLGLGTTLFVYRGQAGDAPGPDSKAPASPAKETPPPPAAPPKPPEWGEPAGDFRIRLREAGPFKVGEVPDLAVDVKYTGTAERAVPRRAEYAEVEVDGRWFVSLDKTLVEVHVDRFRPGIEWPKWLAVRPDATWGHLRDKPGAAGDPGEATKELVPFRLTPGKHTVRVAYSFGKGERAVSNPITVVVAPDGWGDSAGGVKARLRLPKSKLKAGDPLVFELDLKNDGVKTWHLAAVPFGCEVLVDDEPYKFQGELDYKAPGKELRPGGELVPLVTGTVDANWKARRFPDNGLDNLERPPPVYVPFRLTPGRHTIRVAFALDGDKVRPVSNTVEVEVEAPPLDPAVRAKALAADRIWLVPSPTRDKPVPGPVGVLKGPPGDAGKGGLFDLRLLPGDVPGKKWIVFLTADDEGQPTPTVKVWSAAPWWHPHTPETAEAIRYALQPSEWGRAADGLQIGLRLRSTAVHAGQPLVAEVSVRNAGSAPVELRQLRYNIYDYWPDLSFEVTVPDGTKWLLEKPEGRMTEADAPTRFTLKPSETYVHALRLDRWITRPAHAWKEGLVPPANLFATSGDYTITARHAAPSGDVKGKVLTTTPVRLTVTKPAEWGDAVNGMRARIRLAKPRLRADEPLTFELDLRNDGTELRKVRTAFFHCWVNLDGRTYGYSGDIDHPLVSTDLKPQGEVSPLLTVTPGANWVALLANPAIPFKLTSGKHTLSVTYPVDDKTHVSTKPVEFEVAADDWGDPANGARARIRLAKTKLAPGEPLTFDLDLRNDGTTDRRVDAGSILCDLTLDGVPYRYVAALDRKLNLKDLKAASELVPFLTVTPDTGWGTFADARARFKLAPGKHTLSVSYPIDEKTRIATKTVAFEVAADEWGEASGGIRARLRLAKPSFKAGERLAFELDLKNTGDQTVEDGPVPMHCRIDVDGAEYLYTAPISYPTSIQKLTPGKEFVPWVKVETNEWWTHVRDQVAVPLALTPGKHRLRVTYPLPGDRKPVTPTIDFDVVDEDGKAPDLSALVAAADRIVVAKVEWVGGLPKLTTTRTLKGPGTRWPTEGRPIDAPRGADLLPGEVPDDPTPGERRAAGTWVLFLKAAEDGVEFPRLSPAVARGWYRLATDTVVDAVLAALPRPAEAGTPANGLALAVRPSSTTVRTGDEVRLEVVLSNTSDRALRVLQHRYGIYDYWPFLTFTVTGPDGKSVALQKSEGVFKREDYIDETELKPGAEYAHTVRLNRWPNVLAQVGKDLVGQAPFTVPGTYKITATYKAAVGFKNLRPGLEIKKSQFWVGEITSNTVTVEVRPAVGLERRKAFDDAPDRLHLNLYRWTTKTPADGYDGVLHLHATAAPGAGDDRQAQRIVAQEATRLIAALAADGFFDRAYDRGYVTGFNWEQLEEIKTAAPADARRLVGRHAWTTGKLPPGK